MQYEDVRFLSSVFVIFTLAIISHILSIPIAHGAATVTSQLLVLSTFFGYVWFSVFSQWVSRSRRATFNEENLLLTYQPRAYTHGHLFVPEPPTPARFNQGESTDGAASDFKAARDAHYKDEFHAAMNAKVDKKPNQFMNVESMRIEFDDSSPSPSSSGSTVNSGKSPSFHI